MPSTPRPRRYHASSPFQAEPEVVHPVYEVGERVSHDSWGLGRVVSVESGAAVTVDFSGSVRRIILPTSRLEPL